MKYTSPGQHRTVDAFREHLRSVDPELDCAAEVGGPNSALAEPLRLGPRSIGTLFATQPL